MKVNDNRENEVTRGRCYRVRCLGVRILNFWRQPKPYPCIEIHESRNTGLSQRSRLDYQRVPDDYEGCPDEEIFELAIRNQSIGRYRVTRRAGSSAGTDLNIMLEALDNGDFLSLEQLRDRRQHPLKP